MQWAARFLGSGYVALKLLMSGLVLLAVYNTFSGPIDSILMQVLGISPGSIWRDSTATLGHGLDRLPMFALTIFVVLLAVIISLYRRLLSLYNLRPSLIKAFPQLVKAEVLSTPFQKQRVGWWWIAAGLVVGLMTIGKVPLPFSLPYWLY